MGYKPETTPKVAADLLLCWVWFWAPMYISATNLGPFSRGRSYIHHWLLLHAKVSPHCINLFNRAYFTKQGPETITDVTDCSPLSSFFYHVKHTFTSIIFICKLLAHSPSITCRICASAACAPLGRTPFPTTPFREVTVTDAVYGREPQD